MSDIKPTPVPSPAQVDAQPAPAQRSETEPVCKNKPTGCKMQSIGWPCVQPMCDCSF